MRTTVVDLKIADVKEMGFEISPNWSPTKMLLVAAEVATNIYVKEKKRVKERLKGDKPLKKRVRLERTGDNPTLAVLPIQFKNRIQEEGGDDWKLVIEKSLFKTDLSKAHNRLSMPITQINDLEFLTNEEKRIIIKEGSNMIVEVIGPNLGNFELSFKKWDMKKDAGKKSTSFVFIRGWNSLVRNCELELGMKLQVWSFRVNGQLRFAIVKTDETQGQEAVPGSDNSSRGHGEGAMQSATATSPAAVPT